MKTRWILPYLTLILAALACNWSEVAPPAAPVIEPSPLPTFAISTLTSTPTETPLPTVTSTPDAPIAWPKDLGVNCRYGPGKEWEAVSSLPADTRTEIKGRTVDTTWWYVSDPLHLDDFCWVAYDVVDTAGNLNIVPLAEPPAASVTHVSVEALVTFSACGELNPVTFNGTIQTNGPTMVRYHWEVSGDAQETLPDASLNFAQAGTQQISTETFSADCGEYTVSLVVTAPEETSSAREFTVQAP
ncbi:MAG: hypothetical protein PVJ21_13575 [Anaerolineales bacterium]